jgi:hypothetical protein
MTIPANQVVTVTPGVLAAGGNALDLIGIMLTANTRAPAGTILSFPDPTSVGKYFGSSSDETAKAKVYFKGFDNSNVKPAKLRIAQYNAAAVPAYLRGGQASTLTLTQLQALSGSLTVVMDGYPHTANAINLSAATSFSSAASIIGSAINASEPVQANFTGSISGNLLTVSAVASGVLAIGQTVSGTGVVAATIITGLGTATGSTGTYNVNNAQTAISAGMSSLATAPTVSYDSISGAFVVTSGIVGDESSAAFGSGTIAAGLMLTSVTGAVLSQGADATTPGPFMDSIVNQTQDWATFFTLFDPDGGNGHANKLAFAQWTSLTIDRYAYICWDNDIVATEIVPATSTLGYALQQANYDGTCLIYSPDAEKAAFISGTVASIDFTETNGRTTGAFRSQAGLLADVTDAATAVNLAGNPQVAGDFGNGYNFYGAYATANDQFVFFNRGTITGPWDWLDSYINQIWLNNQFQLDLMLMLTQNKSVPYNPQGYALIEAALMDTIQEGLNFGAFRAGVTLSALQAAEVNNAAGKPIDKTLSTQGWYLQIKDALPAVRQNRGSPPCTFWYMDGESVQAINLASIDVQ